MVPNFLTFHNFFNFQIKIFQLELHNDISFHLISKSCVSFYSYLSSSFFVGRGKSKKENAPFWRLHLFSSFWNLFSENVIKNDSSDKCTLRVNHHAKYNYNCLILIKCAENICLKARGS